MFPHVVNMVTYIRELFLFVYRFFFKDNFFPFLFHVFLHWLAKLWPNAQQLIDRVAFEMLVQFQKTHRTGLSRGLKGGKPFAKLAACALLFVIKNRLPTPVLPTPIFHTKCIRALFKCAHVNPAWNFKLGNNDRTTKIHTWTKWIVVVFLFMNQGT
jgi:hypothetical protein